MTDNLRDRITRILNRELLAQLPDALSNGGDLAPSPSGTINLQHLAAVVIAELGLKRDGCPCSQRGPNCSHRYVTEWTADE